MRILHILNDIRQLGNGIINVAIDLACSQAKAGHEVAVVSDGGEYEFLLIRYGVKHFHCNQHRQPISLLKAIRRYRTIVQTFQPDIVHAHMMTGMMLAWFCRGDFPYSLVSTVHNEFQRSSILMGLADRVIAVSHAVARSMRHKRIPAHKLRVVQNGTVGSPRNSSHISPIALCRPAITTIAGMSHRKGITHLITAFEQVATKFKDAHLYLVGDGPDRTTFEAQAKASHASDRIHFEGFQPEAQRYLQSTDVFVLASHQEPFGLVLAEAREAGCAIVASNVDGIPEALSEGKAGKLVPVGNPDILATEITQLLQNAELMNTWKMKAQQNLEWLSVSRMHEETLAVYAELVQEWQDKAASELISIS